MGATLCPHGYPVTDMESACPICQTTVQGEAIPWPAAADFPSIPGYEILSELGRGGMGLVFKARQISLKRQVAIKIIRPFVKKEDRTAYLARFRAEADAVACLQHPNIVQIFEVGEHNGMSYISLEFVEGGSLAKRMGAERLAIHETAALVEKLALAMNVAHQQHLVHLDLKPENVLLTAAGEPKITDFGLARAIETDEDEITDGVGGTPGYMAPEQFAGKGVLIGPAADVFGLGCTLYVLLTGHPPFVLSGSPRETTVRDWRELLDQAYRKPIIPPREHRPAISLDLQEICLTCLRSNPRDRYPSAAALADDLGRFRRGEPVTVRPLRRPQRAWYWCRRNPGAASLVTLLVLALLCGLAGVTWQWRQKTEESVRANQQLYVARMNRVQQAWEDGHLDLFQRLLQRVSPDMRGFEWRYWHRLDASNVRLRPQPGAAAEAVSEVAFSPDDRQLAAFSRSGYLQTWNLDTAKPSLPPKSALSGSALFSPNGRYLTGIAGPEDKNYLRVWDAGNGHDITEFKDSDPWVNLLTFSPDGKWLASASQDQVVIWDMDSRRKTLTLAMPRGVDTMVFSRDGRRFAAGRFAGEWQDQKSGEIKVWKVPDGGPPLVLNGHLTSIAFLAFLADGKRLVSVALDQTAYLWDLASGKAVHSLKEPAGGKLKDMAVSPDGRLLSFTSGDDTVQLLDAATLGSRRTLKAHGAEVTRVTFSPDGERLATASHDRTVKEWDAATGRALRTFKGHTTKVTALAYNRQGTRLASASEDGNVRLWQAGHDQEAISLPPHDSPVTALAFARGGRLLASGHNDGSVRLQSIAGGPTPLILKRKHDQPVIGVAFSPDGKHFVSAGADSTLMIWDSAKDEPVHTKQLQEGELSCLAFSPDGRTLGFARKTYDRKKKVYLGAVTVLDMASRGELSFAESTAPVVAMAFSANSRQLISVVEDGAVLVADAIAGTTVSSRKGDTTTPVAALAFSPDAQAFAVARAASQTVEVCDCQSGESGHVLEGYDVAQCLAYNPAGDRLACAYKDGSVKVWHVKMGQEVLTLKAHQKPVMCIAFSPDGHILAAASDGQIKVWMTASDDRNKPFRKGDQTP